MNWKIREQAGKESDIKVERKDKSWGMKVEILVWDSQRPGGQNEEMNYVNSQG